MNGCIRTSLLKQPKKIEQCELERAKGKRRNEDFIPESWTSRETCTYKLRKTQ